MGAGADRVDPDVVGREALRERAHKADDAELRHRINRAERRADEARGRGGVEERAAAACPQFRDRRLGGHQNGPQVEVDRDLEIGHVDALDRRRARMADMVPHEIEPAKGVGGAPYDVARESILAQIADDAERPAARFGNLPHDRVDPGRVDVDDPDRRALLRKAQRAGPPHPRSRRRDDAIFPLQPHSVASR
jgi:hypothetical protein